MGKVKVKIEKKDGREYVCDIPLEKFPEGYECFLSTDAPNTMDVEHKGAEFLGKCLEHKSQDMLDEFYGRLMDFIVRVLRWGFKDFQYYPILGEICSRQPMGDLAISFLKATNALQDDNLESAIKILDDVGGIGIPVGSKMLRMMLPEKAGAFDNAVLKRKLAYTGKDDYADDWEGYASFCEDCERVARSLNEQGIKHPRRKCCHQWLVADVEATLYWRFKHPGEFDEMAR